MKRVASLMLLGTFALVSVTSAQERGAPDVGAGGTAPVDSQASTAAVVSMSALEKNFLVARLGRATATGRDPFSTSERMRQRAESPGEPRFVPNSGAAIPKLSLRGYVEPRGKPPVALIEIVGQGVYVVRAGDTLGLTVGGRSTVLKVVSIEASSARVEAGSLGQVIVVR